MTAMNPDGHGAVVARAAEAELAGQPAAMVRLLADASATDGALSCHRVTLEPGADGAAPHLHRRSAELFYLLAGTAQVLAGDDVIIAHKGDLLVVPRSLEHAFAAAPGDSADLLIVITPGVERFEYLRHLTRIARGGDTIEGLLAAQDRYDTHFVDSHRWRDARST